MTVSNLGSVLTGWGTHRSLLVVNANMTSTADLSVKGVLVPAPGTNVTVYARTGGSAPPRLTAS